MSRTSVLEVRKIGLTYQAGRSAVRALDGIDFAIAEGEFVSIVGPSGCGKSSLLHIVGGLQSATEGGVFVDGEPVRGPLPSKIAIVFQDAMLLPWKTSLANIEFPLALRGVPSGERRDIASGMLELVGLSEFADRLPHELSGGMRQRISLARGLAQRPRIILMDEPFGALDEQTRLKMGRELLRIWELTRTTILFVTHSLTEAIYLSDSVLVLARRPGRIVERIRVDLPRPRTIEMIGTETFGLARNRLWSLLEIDDELGGMPAVSL